MTALLLDQGLPRSAVALLRDAGWDAVHVAECGLSRAEDAEILEYARTERRAVCTLDADFHALLAVSGSDSPSVIRIRREGVRGDALAAAVEHGAMITLTEHSIRIRRLPIVAES